MHSFISRCWKALARTRDGAIRSQILRTLSLALLLQPAWIGVTHAGTTGTLRGRVMDDQGQPLAAVTIQIDEHKLGAFSDADGKYIILNVPAGVTKVTFRLLGYRAVQMRDVIMRADYVTELDVTMEATTVELEEIVVDAERPIVDIKLTSNVSTVSKEEIELLPVQDLDQVVELQAGVVEGHFRGGRTGEVQYQVDGVTMNNPYDNSSGMRIDRSLLEEVQVISGTFDSEYGQAMSGVVNAVLRRPSEEFTYGGELFLGGFVFPENDGRGIEDQFQGSGIQNFQVNFSGPIPGLGNTGYLVSARRFQFDDYVIGTREFVPTDSSDFENKVFDGNGDGGEEALGYSKEWSGLAKITNRSLWNVEIGYQAIWSDIESRNADWAFRLNPAGLPTQDSFSLIHGLEWTHTVSNSSFYDLSIRHNRFEYKDNVYEDVYDTGYDEAGPPQGDPTFQDGAFVQGVSFTRFQQNTNSYIFKGTFVSQLNADNQVKAGGEMTWSNVQFGTPGHLVYTVVDGVEQLVRHVDEPPDYPGIQEYHPFYGSAFAQDDVIWKDLRLRAGLRLDYFNARTTVPGDPANPANAIAGAPESNPVDTTPKVSLSPRLGVSYPINDKAALFFAYGHFYQMPGLGEMFGNADYGVLSQLADGGVEFGVLGNPDLSPEQTVQYQFGYKHVLTPNVGLDATVFYKDIRDLLGVEFVSTYNNAEYARFTNVDFGNVYGFIIELDQRDFGILSTNINYTWQQAEGNSSDPRETATRAEAGEDPRPRLVPLNWDQRHTLNVTAVLSKPENWSASTIVRAASGQPYTPTIESGFSGELESNSGRKPNAVVVDLRGEKQFRLFGTRMGVFARVFNLFDTRYFNGFVFSSTGSPFYSRFPTTDEATLNDPTRFYPPRRVELGLRFIQF